MRNMRFKVGDRVRIKSLDWYNVNKDTRGQVMCHPSCFVPDMARFCGQVMTIRDIAYGSCYRMKEDTTNYNWTDGMIEELVAFTDETLVERARELFSEPQEKKMKYKPGDRVKLIDESEGIVYRSPFGDITLAIRSLRWLRGWFGQEVTLDSAHNGLYTAIEIKGYYLAEEMIEGLVEEEEIEFTEEDKYWCDIMSESDPTTYVLPQGYQFVDENGNVINATKIVLEKKKKEYPKTIEECKDKTVAGSGYKTASLLTQLERLLICRDAYWKIAGDWKPDYDSGVDKFGIICYNGIVQKSSAVTHWERHANKILDFPTAEMRDAFYENFTELIEECKELL